MPCGLLLGLGAALVLGVAFTLGVAPQVTAQAPADDLHVLGMAKLPESVNPAVALAPGARAPFQLSLVRLST